MGAWGVGSFENDDALDWVFLLQEAEDNSLLVDAFAVIMLPADEPPEAPDCAAALAAAEVVAAMNGAAAATLPDEAQEWVFAYRPLAGDKLTELALQAVRRIKENSELRDLWDESDAAAAWYKTLENLEERLQRPARLSDSWL